MSKIVGYFCIPGSPAPADRDPDIPAWHDLEQQGDGTWRCTGCGNSFLRPNAVRPSSDLEQRPRRA